MRLPGGQQTNLHAFWDSGAVEILGRDPRAVALDVEASITPEQARGWQAGTPATWAMETFDVARDEAYGRLPRPDASGTFGLDGDYLRMARQETKIQLGKAGVRLALILNRSLNAANPIVAPAPGDVGKRLTSITHEPPREVACPEDQVVWINLTTGVYHLPGDRFFGQTKSGAFVCGKSALKEGAHAARGAR